MMFPRKMSESIPTPIFNALQVVKNTNSDTISLVEPVEVEVGGIPLLHTLATSASSSDVLSSSCPNSDEGYCSPTHRENRVLTTQMTKQEEEKKRVYKVVLTGGPCGGKTTGQERLATFFENMGWKVYTVPETATVLLSGGVKFAELTTEQAYEFQKDLLLTLIRIEDVFFNQASLEEKRRVLIICDRGAMDPSAYIDADSWQRMLKECGLEQFNLRENRYDQVIHLVTAADGAERFYTLGNNKTRSESIQSAIEVDKITRQAWLGHPYVDIIDNENTPSFEDKIRRLIEVISDRAGVEVSDRLKLDSKKRKWLILDFDDSKFPKYEEFEVKHDYLITEKKELQVRLRSRCQNNRTTYTLTTRTYNAKDGVIETRMQLSLKDYQSYYRLKDKSRQTIHKLRRCFSFGKQYYNLDIYVDPLPPACLGKRLMILETYTTKKLGDNEGPLHPEFLIVEREITGDQDFSMYSLSQIRSSRLNSGSSSESECCKGHCDERGKRSLSYAELKKEKQRQREEEEESTSTARELPPKESLNDTEDKTDELCFNEDADDA